MTFTYFFAWIAAAIALDKVPLLTSPDLLGSGVYMNVKRDQNNVPMEGRWNLEAYGDVLV